jgi:hypothetical protein
MFKGTQFVIVLTLLLFGVSAANAIPFKHTTVEVGFGHYLASDSLATSSRRVASNSSQMVYTAEVDGERMPWILIPEVVIAYNPVFSSPEARARYERLRYNVIRVLPYAKFAQERYEQLHRDLAQTSNKREQRALVKNCEKEIKDMFNKEVKNLTISQGEILIKLIDRQTGSSSYEVVKELRGGVTAFFYQSIAKVFGHNLKNQYNPQEEREIENILRGLQHSGW